MAQTVRRPRSSGTLAIAVGLMAALAAPALASTPELPPNAGGYVAICPDAANGGLATSIVR